ncbi:hypothetical protein FRC02_011900 [Tulasnella sp. 418]|nr:hypothetical protein FRC02_011900 [Tulasnella sp. 418]
MPWPHFLPHHNTKSTIVIFLVWFALLTPLVLDALHMRSHQFQTCTSSVKGNVEGLRHVIITGKFAYWGEARDEPRSRSRKLLRPEPLPFFSTIRIQSWQKKSQGTDGDHQKQPVSRAHPAQQAPTFA